MKLGQKAMDALRAEVRGRLSVGDDLVVAGAVALRGTVLLVQQKRPQLENYFSRGFLEDCLRLEENYGAGGLENCEIFASPELKNGEITAFYAMGEGGVLSAIWKMAEASGTGLSVDLRSIPIRQETVEVCERFDLNPYRLFSCGAVLLGAKNGRMLAEELARRGLMAKVIGQAREGNDRLLYSGENARYLERPGTDELWKILERA